MIGYTQFISLDMKKLYSQIILLILSLILLVSGLVSCGSSEDGGRDNLLLARTFSYPFESTWEYDAQNRLIKNTSWRKYSDGIVRDFQATICTYNNDGQLVKIIADDKEKSVAESFDIMYQLDSVFVNRVKYIEQDVFVSADTLILNDHGQIVKWIEENTDVVTEYEYRKGKLIKKTATDYLGKNKRVVTNIYLYDDNEDVSYSGRKTNVLENFYLVRLTQLFFDNLVEEIREVAIYDEIGNLKSSSEETISYSYERNESGYPTKIKYNAKGNDSIEQTIEYITEIDMK